MEIVELTSSLDETRDCDEHVVWVEIEESVALEELGEVLQTVLIAVAAEARYDSLLRL